MSGALVRNRYFDSLTATPGLAWMGQNTNHIPAHPAVKAAMHAAIEAAEFNAYAPPLVWFLWILCEIAIIACDLAEVIGSAIALKILFHIPLVWGCAITVADVLAILYLQNRGFRIIEALVITLIVTIAACFAVEIAWSGFGSEGFAGMLRGFLPPRRGFRALAVLAVLLTAGHARANDADNMKAALDTRLAYVKTGLADLDATSRAGLTGLGAVLKALPAETSIEITRRLYEADAERLLNILFEQRGAASIMLIGHNPGLHQLAQFLAGAGDGKTLHRLRTDFPPASLAMIDFTAESWSDIRPGAGRLLALDTPSR